jgi:Flp pilus assembly pilin Flp
MRDDRGVDLIEYALLAGLVSIAALAALGPAGTKVGQIFGLLNTELQKVPTP